MQIEFTLNGVKTSVEALPSISLLQLLREHLGLTGTKEGCDIGECGACTVLLDGLVVAACLTVAGQVSGRSVTTIEGVCEAEGAMSRLQQLFVEQGAVQCGYCMPGFVLAAEALLAANPRPSREDIRVAIAGNLCRCTGYQQIVDAIEAAALGRGQVPR